MASIDNNLIIDLEDGYRALDVMAVQARSANDIFEIKNLIAQKNEENGGKPFYRFITIDNATRLEEMSIPYAADLYRNTPMGAGFGLMKDSKGMIMKNPKNNQPIIDPKADVRLLPNGSGYLYLRKAIRQMIDMFKPLCETLILVTHVKDKQIRKDSQEMSELSVDLAGKTGDIICGEADAIGMIYRDGNKTYVSFEGGDNTIKEARCPHLRGKKILVAESNENDDDVKFDTSKIFINN